MVHFRYTATNLGGFSPDLPNNLTIQPWQVDQRRVKGLESVRSTTKSGPWGLEMVRCVNVSTLIGQLQIEILNNCFHVSLWNCSVIGAWDSIFLKNINFLFWKDLFKILESVNQEDETNVRIKYRYIVPNLICCQQLQKGADYLQVRWTIFNPMWG